ncbi:MAG TPA: hypothetical protein VF044_01405 [Actinomycetota bacterium]
MSAAEGPDADARAGLAGMLDELVRQNLARDPGRRRLLRPTVAVLEVPDAGVVATVRIDVGGVRVVDGDDPAAPVRVTAVGERLFALAAAPLRFGLPDVLDPEGRRVLGDLAAGRIRVRGLVRRLPDVVRLTRLLSAR